MGLAGTVTEASTQGPRPHQEDRRVVRRFSLGSGASGHLLAVLDGHLGVGAAEACADAIPELFALTGPADAEGALKRLVAGLDERTRQMRAGCTVSLVCLLESESLASVAVLGDSPVLTLDRSGRMVASPHHNVRTNLAEREAAEARGGIFDPAGYIVNPATGEGLQMGRSLGDQGMDGILSREPGIYTVELGPRSVVALLTDGVLDLGRPRASQLVEEVLAAWRQGRLTEAPSLIAWAQARGLTDNATAVVWAGHGEDP